MYNSGRPTGVATTGLNSMSQPSTTIGENMNSENGTQLTSTFTKQPVVDASHSGYKKYKFWSKVALILCDLLSAAFWIVFVGIFSRSPFALSRSWAVHPNISGNLGQDSHLPWVTQNSFVSNPIVGTLFILAALLVVFTVFGLYDITTTSSGTETYSRVFNAATVVTLIAIGIDDTLGHLPLYSDTVFKIWLTLLLFLWVGRFVARRITFLLRTFDSLRKRTIIVGAGAEGQAMARQWSDVAGSGVHVVGFVDDVEPDLNESSSIAPYLGSVSDLQWLVKQLAVDSVFLAKPSLAKHEIEKDETFLQTLWHVELQVGTGTSELLASRVTVKEEGFVPIAVLSSFRMGGIHYFAKTLIDYLVSCLILLILWPVLLILAILIAIESPGAAFYRRHVCGASRREFDMFKLRTMRMEGDKLLTEEQKQELIETGKLKNDPRITKVGALVRKYSIDEIPQLFNVLRGEMSLVGPRAITIPEMGRFGRWQHVRTMVKPGLTGLWQVSGRSDLTYEDRAKLDVYYVRNFTIWLDLKILWMTIPAVLFGKGAY